MKDNTTTHFMIHMTKDKEGLVTLPIYNGSFKTKKEARKAMMNLAAEDLVNGRYYFYHLMEHKSIKHETYPSIETTE